MTPDEKAHYYGRMEKNFPQFLKAMERLVAVPSYLKEDDDYPHVPAIKKVLDETMALMKDLGYRTYADPDGYYGWAEIGEGDTLIGVLGHLDVVPPGYRLHQFPPPVCYLEVCCLLFKYFEIFKLFFWF